MIRSIVLLLAPFALYGHDLYLLPSTFFAHAGGVIQVSMHNGDAFPESEGAPVFERVRDAQLGGRGGKADIQKMRVEGKEGRGEVMVPGQGSLVLSLRTIPNFLSMKPDEFLAYLKEEGLDHVIAYRRDHGEVDKPSREMYAKFAKSLITAGAPDDFAAQPAGLTIEIVPEVNPASVHAGGMLPVKVLFEGKPAAGLQLESAWAGGGANKVEVIGRTDAEGRVKVPVAKNGIYRLHSLKMQRRADTKDADWDSFWASLTFEIR